MRKASKVFYTYVICIVTLVGLVGSSAYVSAASASPVPNPIGREGAIPSAVSGSIEKIVTELVDVEGAAPDAVGGAAENLAPRFIERGSNFERWDLGGGRFAWNSAPQWVWDGSEWVPYIYENRWEDGYYQVQSGLIGARVYDYYAEFHTPDLSEIRVHDERWEVQRWVAKGRGRWDDVGAQSGNPVFSILENGNDITVRKTFNSWAGELEINYIFREGLPLKRDVVWTSAIEENTTFRVLQRWAGIAGDKVRHGGGENRVAAALVIDSPFFEFGDDNGMTVLEEQHPMYYDENGERLTEHCLRPVAVDVHARGLKADFAFENWTLAPGESLVVDPYTSTLNNPTQDGHVYYYYASGMSGYSRDSTGNVIKMYDMIVVPYYIYYYYRGYVEWNVSSIPDGATILDTDFKYHGKSTGSGAHIHEMLGARPSTSSDLAVYTEIGEGTTYADPAGFPEAGTNKQVDLGGDADLDLQDQLSSDWFAIGLMKEGTSTTEIYSEDYASANPKPTLYIEYIRGYRYAIALCTDASWPNTRNAEDLLVNTYSAIGDFTGLEGADATMNNFQNAIDTIANAADSNDLVYIHIGAHGYVNGIEFNDGTGDPHGPYVTYTVIDGWLDAINCWKLVITIDACHSGGAIDGDTTDNDDLDDSDNPCPRIIYTACGDGELSDGDFHLAFCDACGLSQSAYTEADSTYGNNNGFVSVREALLYASAQVPENPEESDPGGYGGTTYLGVPDFAL